jgi:anti-anti-sigma regulatory factor
MCLIRYHVLLKNKQKKMRLVKPPEPVYHTLQVAGISKYFDIYDNVQAALATSH